MTVWHEQMGMSPSEIVVATYPSTTLAQIHAALAYYGHRDEIQTKIAEEDRFAEEMKENSPISVFSRAFRGQNICDLRRENGGAAC